MQQLTEPSSHAGGYPLPCHLFMPDVSWPPAMPPVLRPERARYQRRQQQWLQAPVQPGRVTAEPEWSDRKQKAFLWFLALATLAWHALWVWVFMAWSNADAAVVIAQPVVIARPAPVAPRPAPPRLVVHVPAPVVVSPSLARPAVRCERNQLGQCAEVPR